MSEVDLIGFSPEPPPTLVFDEKPSRTSRAVMLDIVAGTGERRRLIDPTIRPDSQNLVPIEHDFPDVDEEFVVGAVAVRTTTGQPYRKMSGKKRSEQFAFPSVRSGTTLMVEGSAHMAHVLRCEVQHEQDYVLTESLALKWRDPRDGAKRLHVVDTEIRKDGRMAGIVEIKRSEYDVRDPEKRFFYACVHEILRRIAVPFEILFARDIFENRTHRKNCELVAMRRFVAPEFRHLERLARLAARCPASTYAEIAHSLEPTRPLFGEALVQGLIVRGRVHVDLTQRLRPSTPASIRPFD